METWSQEKRDRRLFHAKRGAGSSEDGPASEETICLARSWPDLHRSAVSYSLLAPIPQVYRKLKNLGRV